MQATERQARDGTAGPTQCALVRSKTRAARTRSEEVRELFARYRQSRDPALRNRLVLMHDQLVRMLAAKFARRGEPIADLIQVGSIGLIHAVERFDPERGVRFSTFATPTIVGEIKRYFRDTAWMLKAPRAVQELNIRLLQANEQLSQRLGRAPTVAEISAYQGIAEEAALEAMELGSSFEMASLNQTTLCEGADTALTIEDEVGALDPAVENAGLNAAIRGAVKQLDPRSQAIVTLRFYQGLSQMEVARRLQISQMHVSRMQRQALQRLKALLEGRVG